MQELADNAAQADIESFCPWVMRNRHKWFSTEDLGEVERPIVSRAVEYLELRKRLERNRTEPHLVLVK
jgi:hypothetical protein